MTTPRGDSTAAALVDYSAAWEDTPYQETFYRPGKVPVFAPTMPALLRAYQLSHGDKPLFVSDREEVVGNEVLQQSALLARRLLHQGVGKGTRVGLLLPNGARFIIAWLAVTRIGAVAVPVSTLSTAPELGHILRHADVQLLLAVPRYLSRDYVADLAQVLELPVAQPGPLQVASLPYLRDVWFWDQHTPSWGQAVAVATGAKVGESLLAAAEEQVAAADPATIIYTSGSTSAPKGVIHSQGALVRQGVRLAASFPYGEGDRVYITAPMFWVGGLTTGLLNTMLCGATILYHSSGDIGTQLDFIERQRANFVFVWPHVARAMAADPSFGQRDFSALQGGSINEALPPAKRSNQPYFGNALGMTETCGPHSVPLPNAPPGYEGTMGPVMPGMAWRIVDVETREPVADGQQGELLVRGDTLMLGMVKKERSEVFDADGWYPTADLCSVRDGLLFFHGRIDDLIKTSGANVSPAEVEAELCALPQISQAFVVGIPDVKRTSLVAAVVVPEPGMDPDIPAIQQSLAARLSSYKRPRLILAMAADDLPKLSSAKVDKRALRALLIRQQNP